jgi:hypothetical protein
MLAADALAATRPWPAAAHGIGSSLYFNACSLKTWVGPGSLRHGRRCSSRQTTPLSGAVAAAERLHGPFQESARQDFEPLAPNHWKLGWTMPFVKL